MRSSCESGGKIMLRWTYAAAALAATLAASPASAQTAVSAPGSFNSEIGCSGDWQPDCAQAQLTAASATVWRGHYSLPTGSYEFKIAYDNAWTENYGAGGVFNGPNMSFASGPASTVYLSYNSTTHLTDVSFEPLPTWVTLAGSFQSELGCAGDWQPECATSFMTLGPDGLWYATYVLPMGGYEFKIAYDKTWDVNYGAGGLINGPNMGLNIVDPASTVYFRFNETTHLTDFQFSPFAAPAVPEPSTWAMMLLGFGAIGVAMRRRRRLLAAATVKDRLTLQAIACRVNDRHTA